MLIATEGRAVYVQKIPLASPAMPEKLSRLTQKLGQKAKQRCPLLRMPEARACWRAGCGKSASPVR